MFEKIKKYISDNAQLLAEWNWDKNDNLKPIDITIGSGKKYGGNAKKVIHGKPPFIIEPKDLDVLIVLDSKSYLVKMILNS